MSEVRDTPSVPRYPAGAVQAAIDALELSYSYLREKSIIAAKVNEALDLLYRARELEEGVPHPYRESA